MQADCDVPVTPELVATTHGGGLRAGPGLDGFGPADRASGGRGQVLAPWPNRLADGAWSWAGQDLQLPVSEPSRSTAIHGLVRWAKWEVVEQVHGSARLGHTLAPLPGYPFWLRLEVTYRAFPAGWSVTHEVQNLSAVPAPFGLGQHPYFTLGSGLVDQLHLDVRAGVELETDARGLPTGERASEGWTGEIGEAVLDATFTDLARDPGGLAQVRLSAGGRALTIWVDEHYRWVQVFTGDTLAPDRRRRGLAVEAMTCPPNALATGRDLVVLEPDERWSGSWGVELA